MQRPREIGWAWPGRSLSFFSSTNRRQALLHGGIQPIYWAASQSGSELKSVSPRSQWENSYLKWQGGQFLRNDTEAELFPSWALKYVQASRNAESTETFQWPHFLWDSISLCNHASLEHTERYGCLCLPNVKETWHDTQQHLSFITWDFLYVLRFTDILLLILQSY